MTQRQNRGTEINLHQVIGGNYKEFWETRARYAAVKGGRASKKSTTTALWHIWQPMYYFHEHGMVAHSLVVRKLFNSHPKSTFQQLKWATHELGVAHLWKWTTNPLRGVYLPSGSSIIFVGMNDPASVKSVTVDKGYLCWVWVEEAFEISDFEEWKTIELSVARGYIPAPLFPRFNFVLNPVHESTWVKREFFDKVDPITHYSEDGRIYADTRNYYHNEFLDPTFIKEMAILKEEDPRRYMIDGEGEWGTSQGLVFKNIRVSKEPLNAEHLVKQKGNVPLQGIDAGWEDPLAIAFLIANKRERKIYVTDEIYQQYLSYDNLIDMLRERGQHNLEYIMDSAVPRDIDLLRQSMPRVRPVRKAKNFKVSLVRALQDYEIIIDPNCINAIREFFSYAWKQDKETGKFVEELVDGNDHFIDAFLYALSRFGVQTFMWGRDF